ncbi:MAG TPA: aspartate aminotransferase family protein, partial [Chloroflexota bacterium]
LRDLDFYSRLEKTTYALCNGLKQAAAAAGIAVTVNAVPGMLTVFFTPHPVRDLADAEAADTAMFARFFHAMLRRGVYLPPSQFEAWMLSSAHTPQVVQRTIEVAADAFRGLRDGI